MNQEPYKKELAEIKLLLEDSNIYSKPEYPRLAKRASELEDILALFADVDKFKNQEAEALEIAAAEGGELGELAASEAEEARIALTAAEQALQEALIPKDPNDEKDCIIEIRAGAGGDEADDQGHQLEPCEHLKGEGASVHAVSLETSRVWMR